MFRNIPCQVKFYKIVGSTHDMYSVKSLQISFVQSDRPIHCSHIVALIASEQQAKTKHMSRVIRKPTFWFLTWSDTNQAVQLLKMARGLKFQI